MDTEERRGAMLMNKAREIASNFGCSDSEGLAIAVQMEQTDLICREIDDLRKQIQKSI
jgi:hypothetical protein